MSAETLLQFVARRPVVAGDERRPEVTILDRVANAASVRLDASTWIEYVHLCKWNGRWAVLNCLWTRR